MPQSWLTAEVVVVGELVVVGPSLVGVSEVSSELSSPAIVVVV